MCVRVKEGGTRHFSLSSAAEKPYCSYKQRHISHTFTGSEQASWNLCPSVLTHFKGGLIHYVKSPICLLGIGVCFVCLSVFSTPLRYGGPQGPNTIQLLNALSVTGVKTMKIHKRFVV